MERRITDLRELRPIRVGRRLLVPRREVERLLGPMPELPAVVTVEELRDLIGRDRIGRTALYAHLGRGVTSTDAR